jgi:hypothetical protein
MSGGQHIMVDITRSADLTAIGSNGGLWIAGTGTAAPANPVTQPAAPWLPAGAISDDGTTYGFDEDNTEFQPWGLTSPFRTTITKSIRTLKFTLWETSRVINASVMFRVAVADLAPDPDGYTAYAETASPTPDRRAWYLLVFDGDVVKSLYVPQGEVTDRGDVVYKQDTISGFDLTVTAYPDDAGNTVYHMDKVPVTPAYTGS